MHVHRPNHRRSNAGCCSPPSGVGGADDSLATVNEDQWNTIGKRKHEVQSGNIANDGIGIKDPVLAYRARAHWTYVQPPVSAPIGPKDSNIRSVCEPGSRHLVRWDAHRLDKRTSICRDVVFRVRRAEAHVEAGIWLNTLATTARADGVRHAAERPEVKERKCGNSGPLAGAFRAFAAGSQLLHFLSHVVEIGE